MREKGSEVIYLVFNDVHLMHEFIQFINLYPCIVFLPVSDNEDSLHSYQNGEQWDRRNTKIYETLKFEIRTVFMPDLNSPRPKIEKSVSVNGTVAHESSPWSTN